jgi:hypothetical protein
MRGIHLLLLLAAVAPPVFGDDEPEGRNRLTGPPQAGKPALGRPADVLRHQASDLRMRAFDARDAADALHEKGRDDKADEMDDRADDLEDRAHQLEQRADDMDSHGENATRGMVLPAPNPAAP